MYDYPVQHARLNYRFTGKERDSESGNDYFGARYYASTMGRWMSPDPSGLVYADPKNPQSLNLYAYVLNNPLIHIDPRGLDCVYFNDAGNGVESVDHHSNSGECGQNGGDRAPQLAHALRTALGHTTPLGTPTEIRAAIQAALAAGAYSVSPDGVAKGTAIIQGVAHEFTGFVNGSQFIFSNIYGPR